MCPMTEPVTAMNRLASVLMAVMLVLAGCSGAPGLSGGPSDGTSEEASTVNFYVSDEENAIDDFEHLNVTITKVGLHRADASDGADANGTAENESDDENATEMDEERDGEWVTRDVDDVTLDLTELKGENATVLTQLNVSSGTYDKAFIYVGEVNGTLKDGNTTDVKLPSERLHVNGEFTAGANESVDFVYDVTVVKRGKSGRYNIKPVVSESGTDVPIKEVERDEDGLGARFAGDVERGRSTTVEVTREGEPVSGATVTVNDETYRTAGDGTVTFDMPSDAEEVEVEVEHGDGEAELKRTFAESEDAQPDDDADETEADSDEARDDEAARLVAV